MKVDILQKVLNMAKAALSKSEKYKGHRLARRIVITEAAAFVEFNKDDEGNPLNSLLGGKLIIHSGTNVSITTASCQMQLNGVTSGGYWRNGSSSTSAMVIGTAGGLFTYASTDIDMLNNTAVIGGIFSYMASGGGSAAANGGGMLAPQTSITAIKLFMSSGTFPAGTIIEWWEKG